MERDIISIDEKKCDGCGLCIPGCPEGALQIIDGKARLVSELSCDGLGACLGECPKGALHIERKEAPPYDERVVMSRIVLQGEAVIRAHLKHLKDHGETEHFNTALDYLQEMGDENPLKKQPAPSLPSAGSAVQWPVQLALVKGEAPFFRESDLLLTADCVAFTVKEFHSEWRKNRTLAIACPKLDNSHSAYREKLKEIIDRGGISSLTVMIMDVPCCSGLWKTAREAAEEAKREIPLTLVTVSRDGRIIKKSVAL